MAVTLQQVEELRKYVNVSYAEAKAALEASGGDLLDAVIELERQGKTKEPGVSGFDTSPGADAAKAKAAPEHPDEPAPEEKSRRKGLRGVWDFLVENHLEAYRRKEPERVIQIPLAALIALVALAWYVMLVLAIVGFFLGWRYRFAGPQLGRKSVNDVMDSIDDAAESVAENIKDGVRRNFGREP